MNLRRALDTALARGIATFAVACALHLAACGGTVVYESGGGDGDGDGPRTGKNGCPSELDEDGLLVGKCVAGAQCNYYSNGCLAEYGCLDGQWYDTADCLVPAQWCPTEAPVVGEPCSYISLGCPESGATAVCGPDYTWERP